MVCGEKEEEEKQEQVAAQIGGRDESRLPVALVARQDGNIRLSIHPSRLASLTVSVLQFSSKTRECLKTFMF